MQKAKKQNRFAVHLKEARHTLSLRDVEQITGIDKDTLLKIERGLLIPRTIDLPTLCEFIGFSFNDAFAVMGVVSKHNAKLNAQLRDRKANRLEQRRQATKRK